MYNLSPDDLRWLCDPETEALTEKHLSDDPVQLAFRLKCGREQARLVCQQVKYLQRAKSKLPSYYHARCVIPPLSYEQCSSEAAAAEKKYSGKHCIDLTCGLGVDSFHFSKHFEQVVAVERDPVLAEAARLNFRRLGAANVTVKNRTAEDFLTDYSGEKADLIYIDPARRNENERVFLLEACSPHVIELLPVLLKKADRILIKLSPLYDIGEALRVFHPHVSVVEVVSIRGEVKELLVELTGHPEKTEIRINRADGTMFTFTPEQLSLPASSCEQVPSDGFLLIPDVAFYKARAVQALVSSCFQDQKISLADHNGFAFAGEYPEGFPGRVFRILETMEYQPKHLKKRLKEKKIKRINLLRRHFPYKSDEIKRILGIEEGGKEWFAFTEITGKSFVFRVEPF